MKWLRSIAGPQPVLRMIAALLAGILAVLVLILFKLDDVLYSMPPDCGALYFPCTVQIK